MLDKRLWKSYVVLKRILKTYEKKTFIMIHILSYIR